MGVKCPFALVQWVPFCVCVIVLGSFLAVAQRGFTVCDMEGCTCSVKAAPWKVVNCSLFEEKIMNLDPSSIPKGAFEVYIFGGQEVNIASKTFNSLQGLTLLLINNTRRVVIERKSFYEINSSSLLIQITNCDELLIRTGAFENIQSSVSIEVFNVTYVTIEQLSFSKLSSGLFKNIEGINLYERSFDFKNQGNIGRHGPVTTISFEDVAIPEIPTESFLKSLARVSFEDSRIGVIHKGAFKATEISALTMINTTVRDIEPEAFTDWTLIRDFKISKCNISKLRSKAIKSGTENFILNHSILMDIEPGAIVITAANAELIGNQISNFQSRSITINNWNKITIDDNIIKDLRSHFIDIANHADVQEFSFKGNEIYNVEHGALSFLSEFDEKFVVFDDNFFNQSCNCTIDKWLEGVTNSTSRVKVAMDTSFCIVDELLSDCFSLPVGIINIQNFTERTCSNFTKCEPYEGKTRVINTTSKIFIETSNNNNEKRNWLILVITVISLFILATIITFVVLLVKGSRWLKEKGYFRNIYYNNNELSNEDEVTTVTVDENEKLEIPEELTLEFLQVLSRRLDDPTTHQEASEMIERLYEMFIVDESYENNNREEEAHLYEELGNLNLQIPPPPYEEEAEPASDGARNILKLIQEKFNEPKPTLMGEYSEPTDAAVHLYSELRNKNETSENRASIESNKSEPVSGQRKDNFAIEPGPSTKL